MPSILLVDDSGLFHEIAEKIERRTHCRLLLARSGGEALGAVRREQPDIVFLDEALTGMTGFDVCRVIKADSHFSRTPVVLFSDRPDAAEAARRAGADECLAKPLDEATVFESIRRHLRLYPRDDPRTAAGWSVTFWRDGVQHVGTIRDLSRGGFFIRTAVRQPIGARLEVSVDVPAAMPGRAFVAEALVVRIEQEPEGGLGCRFFRITAGSRSNLEECLKMLESSKT
jgi:CheY-like chemotaxis protein